MAGVVTLQVARQLERAAAEENIIVLPSSWNTGQAVMGGHCGFLFVLLLLFWLCSEPKDVPLVPTMLQHKQAIQQQIDWLL